MKDMNGKAQAKVHVMRQHSNNGLIKDTKEVCGSV